MKHSEASKLVIKLLPITQKFRSNSKEAVERLVPYGTSEKVIDNSLFDMFPWIFDDVKLMRFLVILNERLDKEQEITGMEFYNLMIIFHRFEPEATFAIEIAFEMKLPEPNPVWCIGWDAE